MAERGARYVDAPHLLGSRRVAFSFAREDSHEVAAMDARLIAWRDERGARPGPAAVPRFGVITSMSLAVGHRSTSALLRHAVRRREGASPQQHSGRQKKPAARRKNLRPSERYT